MSNRPGHDYITSCAYVTMSVPSTTFHGLHCCSIFGASHTRLRVEHRNHPTTEVKKQTAVVFPAWKAQSISYDSTVDFSVYGLIYYGNSSRDGTGRLHVLVRRRRGHLTHCWPSKCKIRRHGDKDQTCIYL